MKRLKYILLPALAVFAMTALSCFDPEGNSSGDSGSVILYNQKIITNDDFFAGSHWNDPHVIYKDGQFVMYASSDISWDGYVKIYRLTSDDGKNWVMSNSGNPVLEPSASGWDSHCVETPAVVYFNGQYHMFYTGYDVPYSDPDSSKHFRIGHAASPDGISWTKDSSPVVSPTDPYGGVPSSPPYDFNQYIVGEPAPAVFNNKIYLYFTAVGAAAEVGTTWQTIGLVASSDGTSWDAPRRVLTPDLSLYPRNSGAQYIGYSTPNAVVLDGRVHIYCDVVINDPWTQDKIHHASSADGETGWAQDSAPLLERTSYAWTAGEIRSPSALLYDNDLYLYFAGHYFEGINHVLSIGLIVYDSY